VLLTLFSAVLNPSLHHEVHERDQEILVKEALQVGHVTIQETVLYKRAAFESRKSQRLSQFTAELARDECHSLQYTLERSLIGVNRDVDKPLRVVEERHAAEARDCFLGLRARRQTHTQIDKASRNFIL